MAARLNPRHQQFVRDKIKARRIVEELQKHIDGEREMSSTQIRAAQILLDKSVPSLQAMELTGENGTSLIGLLVQDMGERAVFQPKLIEHASVSSDKTH